MNFEFSEEQQLLREQARGFLTEHCPATAVRAVLDGDQDWDAELWQKVAEMGWTATVIPEAYGCLLYTSPSPRDGLLSRMPSSA